MKRIGLDTCCVCRGRLNFAFRAARVPRLRRNRGTHFPLRPCREALGVEARKGHKSRSADGCRAFTRFMSLNPPTIAHWASLRGKAATNGTIVTEDPESPSAQRVEIGCHVAGVHVADAKIRHGGVWIHVAWVADPSDQVLWTLRQNARDVDLLVKSIESRADVAMRAGNSRNLMAAAAPILAQDDFPTPGVCCRQRPLHF